MLAIFHKKTSTYVNENQNQNRKLNGPGVEKKRSVMGFGSSLLTITPWVVSSVHLREMSTGTKPWTLHGCTLDMTRLPRRHTNSGNPKMFFDKSLRTTESVVVVRVR